MNQSLRSAIGRLAPGLRAPYYRYLAKKHRRHYKVHGPRALATFASACERCGVGDIWWIWAGAVLGWARNGELLPFDEDVDLCIARSDVTKLLDVVEQLEPLGVKFRSVNVGTDGRIALITFDCIDIKFDFWVFDTADDYWYYRAVYQAAEPFEILDRLPVQPLEVVTLSGTHVRKVKDHERELEILYGDWRSPNPGWSYLEDGNWLEKSPWTIETLDLVGARDRVAAELSEPQ